MRFIAALFVCLVVPASVAAKPVSYPMDTFQGDRYAGRATQEATHKPIGKARYLYRVKRKPHVAPRRRAPGYVAPLTLAHGFQREVGRAVVLGGRPAGCPARAWCGCWLASHLGIRDRSLWLARNWARVGASAGGPRPGAIAVWRHHVGKITAVDGHRILVLSGNDSRAVRHRWRTTAGVIAYRFAG